MITPTQYLAEVAKDLDVDNTTPLYTPLTNGQQLLLENLVKSYPPYINAVGKWPDLSGQIDQEQSSPTDKTYFLKAILTALDELPSVLAESSGSDTEPGFFSVGSNWAVLAQDVLNTLYVLPIIQGPMRFALVQRRIEDLVLDERSLIINETIGSV